MDGHLKLQKLLKNKGFSITRPRLAVFDALQESDEPLPVSSLCQRVKNIDRTSVYRTIDLFESAGIVHRVWTGFKSRIELTEEFSEHHHHFTCVSCGKIISFDSKDLEEDLARLEQKKNFQLTHHSIELSGFCERCAK